jgi:hypothetical protein
MGDIINLYRLAATHAGVSKVALKNLLIMAGAFLFCGSLMHPVFDGQWSLIDDHWAMHFVSKIKRLGLSFWHIVPLTLDSEVGEFGNYPRYRPSYYFLYVAEAFLWGDDANLWWRARFGIFSLLFASLWWFVSRWVNTVSAFVFTAWLFLPGYWVDIWGRLGPGEIYAALGLALFIVGAAKWYEGLRPSADSGESLWLPCAVTTLGAVIAAGSKENFVLLLVPVFILTAWSWLSRRGRAAAMTCFLVSGAYCALVAGSILIYLVKNKTDVYNREVTSSKVSALLWQEISRLMPLVGGISAVIIGVCILGTVLRRGEAKSFLNTGLTFGSTLLLLLLLHISQFVFYNGNYPTNMRYDFPGAFVVPFCWLAGYLFLSRCLLLVGVARVVDRLVVVATTLMFFSIIHKTGYGYFTSYMAGMREQTSAFTQRVTKTANKCKKRPELPILFDSYSVWDFEKVGSIRRFLLAQGVRNPMMLRVNYGADGFLEGSLERSLTVRLHQYSQGSILRTDPESEWSADFTTFGFSPLSDLSFDQKFLVIGFGLKPTLPHGVGVGVY